VWWYTPIIPAFRRLRQKNHKFEPIWATYWDHVSKKKIICKNVEIFDGFLSVLNIVMKVALIFLHHVCIYLHC
jgi:hypothetical protein